MSQGSGLLDIQNFSVYSPKPGKMSRGCNERVTAIWENQVRLSLDPNHGVQEHIVIWLDKKIAMKGAPS